MAQTIPDIDVTSSWQSVNTLTGITIGSALVIDNKSNAHLVTAEGTQPAIDDLNGVPISPFDGNNSTKVVPAGSLEVWIRVNGDITNPLKVSIQEK